MTNNTLLLAGCRDLGVIKVRLELILREKTVWQLI